MRQGALFAISDNRNQKTDNTNRSGPKSPISDRFVDSVLGMLVDACRSIGPDDDGKIPRGPQAKRKQNRAKVRATTHRENASLDDWRTVIENITANVIANPQWRHTLCLAHICRPDNWRRWNGDAPKSSPRASNGRAATAHAPSDFTKSEHRISWGDDFGDVPTNEEVG